MKRIGAWAIGCAAACVLACSADNGDGDHRRASDAGSGGHAGGGAGGVKSAAGGTRSSGGSEAGGRPAAGAPAAGAPPAMPDASLDGRVVVGNGGAFEAGIPDGARGEPDGALNHGGAAGGAGTGGTGTGGAGRGGQPLDAGEAVDGGDAGDSGCDPGAPEPWTVTSHLDAQGRLVAPSDGFQVVLPTIDLPSGAEQFLCAHVTLPNSGEFDVGEWESQLLPGIYEFTLYRGDGDTVAPGTVTNTGCTVGFGGRPWLYTSSAPHTHLAFPPGVGMDLLPNQKVLFDIHVFNPSLAMHTSITLNARKAGTRCGFQVAQAQVSFNFGIAIPANGKQTVGGDCTPPAGAKYFYMTTKTHRLATLAVVSRKLADGTLGEDLVRTTLWSSPNVSQWQTPPFLTFGAGEKFHYSCTYQNTNANTVGVGTSAQTGEWCSAITYYFPAGPGTPTCN